MILIRLLQLVSLSTTCLSLQPCLPQPRQKRWIIPAYATSIVTVTSIWPAFHWLLTGDVGESAYTVAITLFLQNYLLVESLYLGTYFPKECPILEFWIHHPLFIILFQAILLTGNSGFMRPFFILELPTAIRSIGQLLLHMRNDTLFGLSFFLFRVIWPFYVIWHIFSAIPSWSIIPICLMQTAHCYWFYIFCKKTLPRPQILAT